MREPPAIPGHFLFGNARELQADRLGFLLRNLHTYGDVTQMRVFGRRVYTVYHPDAIRHVLQDNHPNYQKGPLFDPVRAVAGRGLFTADGELWLRQRRMMQPAFHRQRIAGFGQVMTGQAERMLARWDAAVAGDPDRPLDVSAEMVHLTMAVVSEAMFGAAVEDQTDAISRAIRLPADRHWPTMGCLAITSRLARWSPSARTPRIAIRPSGPIPSASTRSASTRSRPPAATVSPICPLARGRDSASATPSP